MKIIKEIPGAVYSKSDDGKVTGQSHIGVILEPYHLLSMFMPPETLERCLQSYDSGNVVTIDGPYPQRPVTFIRKVTLRRPDSKDMTLTAVSQVRKSENNIEDYELGMIQQTLKLKVPKDFDNGLLHDTLKNIVDGYHLAMCENFSKDIIKA